MNPILFFEETTSGTLFSRRGEISILVRVLEKQNGRRNLHD
ncbi:hypothetical protein HMPREF3199_01978 [Enterococcus faecium]|nr:hypothetical protein HMPREF1347_02737 [Enterococcus faecium 504]EPI16368.1 hypothetical protein D355_01504 [Enterococcus faecium SD1C-2]EPI20303.1 hypothetical protein D353_01487 [Enterococcus faecium OC2A-1]KXA07361.1 hypothetical protein HMPREF3199_01978 [Enterococcus faecium]MBL4989835.1 hypothetical protein [Enterococcus lactis]